MINLMYDLKHWYLSWYHGKKEWKYRGGRKDALPRTIKNKVKQSYHYSMWNYHEKCRVK